MPGRQGCRRRPGRAPRRGEYSHTGSASRVGRDSRVNYTQVTHWHTRTAEAVTQIIRPPSRLLNITGMSAT
jgi:hypothetical protein